MYNVYGWFGSLKAFPWQVRWSDPHDFPNHPCSGRSVSYVWILHEGLGVWRAYRWIKQRCNHKKELAALKLGPTVTSSWMSSSTPVIPNLPRFYSMIELSWMARRWPLTLANPRLYTSSRTRVRVGYLRNLNDIITRRWCRARPFWASPQLPCWLWSRLRCEVISIAAVSGFDALEATDR